MNFFKLTTLTTALTLIAGTTFADDKALAIDLSKVCDPGCEVLLAVEPTRTVNGSWAGEISAVVTINPMEAFHGVALSDNSGIRYTLIDFPGRPSFQSLELVTDFINHDNERVAAARKAAGS